jgi:hypothetical protein
MKVIKAGNDMLIDAFSMLNNHQCAKNTRLILVQTDEVRDAIIDVAREVHADCILVGPRGRGRLMSALLGSVTNYLANHSPVPVLIARTDPKNPPPACAVARDAINVAASPPIEEKLLKYD